jgi:hypothetical protein
VDATSGVLQLSNFQVARPPTNFVAVTLHQAQATLLNCPISPEQVKPRDPDRDRKFFDSDSTAPPKQ